MNKIILNNWIKNLRSGEYNQGYFELMSIEHALNFDEVSYCCLGVLLKTCLQHKEEVPTLNDKDITNLLEYSSSLNEVTAAALKLSNVQVMHLQEMNDTKVKSFNEIANWIEHYITPE